MTTKSFWTNSDGLRVRFGTMPSEERKSGVVDGGADFTGCMVLEFDYVQANAGIGADSGADLQRTPIPIGAIIRDVKLEILTAWAGGTGLNIGTEQADGTDLDADGFYAAGAAGALANLTPAGATVVGETTEIGTVLSNTQKAYVLVAASGTFTAGKARLVVRWDD
jgi:hypothetical protein